MKKLILFTLLSITFFSASAQKDTDRWKAGYDVGLGVLPIKLSSSMNVAGNSWNPVYKRVDTTGLLGVVQVHLNLNMPFYRTETWSVGAKIHAGAARLGNLKAAEGLAGYALDFPQYLYYRNYKHSFDYSILIGYKYTIAPLNYGVPLVALGWNREGGGFLVYGSLKRDTYYSLYSNGEAKPFLKIGEFGLKFYYLFGN